MLTIEELGPRAVAMRVSGQVTREDVDRAMAALSERPGGYGVYCDVAGQVSITPGVVVAELMQMPQVIGLVRAIDRLAVVADQAWIRNAAKVESKLLPGIDYRVFDRGEAAEARAWIVNAGEG